MSDSDPKRGSDTGRLTAADRASKDSEKFSDKTCDGSAEPCPYAKKTSTYFVEVRVVTRLGGIAVKGVKALVDGEDFGASDSNGEYKNGRELKRRKTNASSVGVVATYENSSEKLKKEKVEIQLTEVDPMGKSQQGGIANSVSKVQDVAGGGGFDFTDNYRTAEVPEQFGWKDSDDGPVLQVEIRLATLSLNVPYYNQNCCDHTVSTIASLDPESEPHEVFQIVKRKHTRRREKFAGSVLCYPSSMTMLLGYWGVIKVNERRELSQDARQEVMQEFYRVWGGGGFGGRPDKTAIQSASEPANPAPGMYWLDTSHSFPGSGFALRRVRSALDWEDIADPTVKPDKFAASPPTKLPVGKVWKNTKKGTLHRRIERFDEQLSWMSVRHDPKEPKHSGVNAPDNPREGDLWEDQVGPEPVLRKYRKGIWVELEDSDWRANSGGSRVWQWNWIAIKLLETLVSEGKAPKCSAPAGPKWKERYLPVSWPSDADNKVHAEMLKAGNQPLLTNRENTLEALKKRHEKEKNPKRAARQEAQIKELEQQIKELKDPKLDENAVRHYADLLGKGWPFVVGTTASGSGHMMIARGAVVSHLVQVQWLIVNDPYGNLASPGSLYCPLAINATVGCNGHNAIEDVRSVQETLKAFGHYEGDADGICDGEDPKDPVIVAIRKYQGNVMGLKKTKLTGVMAPNDAMVQRLCRTASYREKTETNKRSSGEDGQRGRHVYYNNNTQGVDQRLRVGGRGVAFPRLQKDFSRQELADRLVAGA